MSSSVQPEGARSGLGQVQQELEELLGDLQDVNSSFPATRRFLEAKGLRHLSELDRDGLKELREFLEAIYRRGHPGH